MDKTSSLTVSDPKVAAFLNDTTKNRFMTPFIARERSLSEAAKIVGVKLNTMTYWVKKLLEMKLLQQTRTESRKGSSMRYYRSVADEIIVPADLIPKESYEAVLLQQFQPLFEHLIRISVRSALKQHPGGWNLHFSRRPDGIVWREDKPDLPGGRRALPFPALNDWYRPILTKESAKRLEKELIELLERYQAKETNQKDSIQKDVIAYVAHIALVPDAA
jgi:DNA-binding transcriptional ArsR family regulator